MRPIKHTEMPGVKFSRFVRTFGRIRRLAILRATHTRARASVKYLLQPLLLMNTANLLRVTAARVGDGGGDDDGDGGDDVVMMAARALLLSLPLFAGHC